MEREEILISNIEYYKGFKPEPLFETPTAIYFREIEDLIAYWHQNKRDIRSYRLPAWRYYCDEGGGQNRYYYLIEAELKGKYIKLITGDATDFSGHGGYDKELAEFFIEKVLHLDIEDRPLTYLFGDLVNELYSLSRKEIDGV